MFAFGCALFCYTILKGEIAMKKLVSILLVCLLLCTAVPFCGFAADDAMKVVISLEGFTLGQGYYVEPTAYTVDQINKLVEKDNLGTFTEDTLTAGAVTIAMLNDKNLSREIKNSPWDGKDYFYLGQVNDIDTGKVAFPAVVTENGGPSNTDYVPNTDKNLGEFDYMSYSGWMITVNDSFIGSSAWDCVLKKDTANTAYGNTYVIRWQFTLGEYNGLDTNRVLGYPGWDGSDPYFPHANKDQAMIAYAESSNPRAKAKAKPVLEKLDATQAEVDAVIEPLGKAETVWERILDFFDRIVAFFKNLFKIG